MEIVTGRRRNPFGLQPPCGDGVPVCGYGDPSADFHVIGDHPGVHGGRESGVPFTGSTAGRRLQGVLHEVGLIEAAYADAPTVSNLYLSYLYMCAGEADETPAPRGYATHERFVDAEVRAVNAHVLLPVGRRATEHVLEAYTTRARKVPSAMDDRHGTDIRGRGFLVIPITEPAAWTTGHRHSLLATLRRILASDYRQTKGVATLVG